MPLRSYVREFDLTVDGRTIHCAETGAGGLPLVMLHGVTRRWQTFLPVMQALSVRWQVTALDQRGHGMSGRADGQYKVIDYVGDLTRFVQQQFDEPVVLYGHSLGAMVVAAAAAELGDRVRAVVMEDPPFATMGTKITDNVLHSFFSGLSRFAGDLRTIAEIAQELADVLITDPQQNRTFRLGEIRDATQLRFSAASLQQLDPRVFDSILAGQWLDGYDTESIFRRLPCPALLLQADIASGGMLTDDDARDVTGWARDLTHVRLNGVGHVIHVARTSELINAVHTFLESL